MNPASANLDELRIDRNASGGARRGRAWLVVVLVLVAAGGAYILSRGGGGLAVRSYTVVAAASEGGRVVLNASGYVVARREATVSSKITGKVVEVLVEEGMQVREGQVLARLDDTNVRAALALAEAQLAAAGAARAEIRAQLEQAERELRRLTELRRNGVTSEAEVDRADAEVRTLRARLEHQQSVVSVAEREVGVWHQQLEDTIIRAPFSGMATAKNAQPGEMISPISAGGGFTRTGIGTIVDMSSLEVEVDVNESYLHRVRAGQRVEASLDAYPDWRIPGKVIAIIPTADRQKATVRVRVGFDQLDPRILPQMGVRVAFLGDAAEAANAHSVVVPRAALRKEAGRDTVYVVTDGRAVRRVVTLGLLRADEASVIEGLSPGEQVVLDPPEALKDGSPVRAEKGSRASAAAAPP